VIYCTDLYALLQWVPYPLHDTDEAPSFNIWIFSPNWYLLIGFQLYWITGIYIFFTAGVAYLAEILTKSLAFSLNSNFEPKLVSIDWNPIVLNCIMYLYEVFPLPVGYRMVGRYKPLSNLNFGSEMGPIDCISISLNCKCPLVPNWPQSIRIQ